jgi:hypothetical protein
MRFLCLILGCAVAAWPQATVENATITGATTAGAAAANGVGKSIGKVFDSLSKTADKAAKPAGAAVQANKADVVSVSVPNQSAEPAPSTKLVDPSQVTIGLSVDDLVELCGEPFMSISQMKDSQFVETYWYHTIRGGVLEVTLRDSEVTAVKHKPTQSSERAAAVSK